MIDMDKMTLWDDHLNRNYNAYAPGVLNIKQHFQLVEEMARYCNDAGVSSDYVTHSMLDYCQDEEMDWMRSYPTHFDNRIYGAAFLGGVDILPRMSAMVGCAMRNYIQARIITLQSLLNDMKSGDTPNEELLFISNFCLPKNQGGAIAVWQIPLLVGLLYDRFSKKKHTVVYVSSIEDLRGIYGDTIAQHIKNNFTLIKG